MKYAAQLVIADSGIPGAGNGLFLTSKEELTIEPGEIITYYDGTICHTDDLQDFAKQQKLPFELIESYTCSLCAQSAAGIVIVGHALPGEKGPNYETLGPVSFVNCSLDPNTRFKVTPYGILLVAKRKLTIQAGALELTVSYGNSLAHQPELQGLTRAQLTYDSKVIPIGDLTGIKAIGGVLYSETKHYVERIRLIRAFCQRSSLSVPKDTTDQALLDFFDQQTPEKSWKTILREKFPAPTVPRSIFSKDSDPRIKHAVAEEKSVKAVKRLRL